MGWLPPDVTSSRSCLCLSTRVGLKAGLSDLSNVIRGFSSPACHALNRTHCTFPLTCVCPRWRTALEGAPEQFSTSCPRRRVPQTLAERWASGGELRPISQLSARVAWGRPITSQATAQTNPTSSRATAVITTHIFFPA